ncbi:succinate dehydrogenase subunit 3-2, mitochondrial-like isoform X2 [Iris pallida]|uniref:Succinate dehydrogenase subunit 3-2, mitochondrial-like isoform X2 n=1 Tax=Iris pallida TaxID=29817 RepID=A0AAX6EGG7_IRIPA|nr:succinate dehydrogenase subunit 3-2, mitochondrial-like isoform X2 [Iris pallida]
MDAPFALRGCLAHTSSKYPIMDGFRLSSPSLEHKSVTRSPYTPSFLAGTSPSIVVPSGSRALHGSRVLAESSKGAISNRPLSPHLALKKPQMRATFSISHRIFGAALASGIMLLPVAMKFSLLYDV